MRENTLLRYNSRCLIALCLLSVTLRAYSLSPSEVLSKIDDVYHAGSIEGQMHLTTVQNGATKETYAFSILSHNEHGVFIEFISPAREKGKKILRKENNIWLMTPSISKPLRLSKKDSFMGSSFSNSDILSTRFSNEFSVESVDKDTIGSRSALRLNLIGKDGISSYARAVLWADPATYVLIKAEYFTISGTKARILTIQKTASLAGRIRASQIKMENPLVNATYDVVEIISMKSRTDLSSDLFNPRSMMK